LREPRRARAMSESRVGSKSELLNVLGDVKARVQEKLGIVDFPMPQFILIGKQSVGKSRLIETLAGETFNFISGTLGSRRPTVLEFRHVDAADPSRWFIRNPQSNQWQLHPIAEVMRIVGERHNELGESVSASPIYVRIESSGCVDMQIVDLPGFRDFASNQSKQKLAGEIEELDMQFMRDPRNVMLCVEQAGDAATMSSLAKCRNLDPRFQRTILIRNKLDKYYKDLTQDNVNKWVNGYGDLPEDLPRFALTLPFWHDGATGPPKPFREMINDKDAEDKAEMQRRGLSEKYLKTIGFSNFAAFMERKIEHMFGEAIGPVLSNLRELKESADSEFDGLSAELQDTDPKRIISTVRDCGVSFAMALTHVMEGVLELKPVQNLEEELREFHDYHHALGSTHFSLRPSEEFVGLDDYIHYLRSELQMPTFSVEVNGGAQFRRLMFEVEVFLRFSEISDQAKKKDVIQARGVSMTSLTWRDVVVKLLSNMAHLPLQARVMYVGERLKWFFQKQKDAILNFMSSLEGTPAANLFSPLFPRHAKLISQNEMIRHLVYETYDKACQRQLKQFVDLFEDVLTATFSNPWVFLKAATTDDTADDLQQDWVLPNWEDTQTRIKAELSGRCSNEGRISTLLLRIPEESTRIDDAIEDVEQLVLRTYGFIRSQVCDQVELFAESFFKLPMMRRLEEDMALIELSEQDLANYKVRRERLEGEMRRAEEHRVEIDACISRIQGFLLTCAARPSTQR